MEQEKDWWLKKHTDNIVAKKDISMEISNMISMFAPSSGKNIDDRNKLVEILHKIEVGEIEPTIALDEARKIFSEVEIITD